MGTESGRKSFNWLCQQLGWSKANPLRRDFFCLKHAPSLRGTPFVAMGHRTMARLGTRRWSQGRIEQERALLTGVRSASARWWVERWV